jgi:hypothetical protein
LGAGVDAAVRTVEITNEQYNQGAVDFTAVFVFQSDLTDQQDLWAQAQGDIALGLIAVYRALGGGWQIRLDGAAPEMDTLDIPRLEEIPQPEAANDIEFQSITANPSFMTLKQPSEVLQAVAPQNSTPTVAAGSPPERKSS